MKNKRKAKSGGNYPSDLPSGMEIKEVASLDHGGGTTMVRTQIYLTREEHEFLQGGAERRGEPMSAFLRSIIEERMRVPEDAWRKNPMLEPTPEVEGWRGAEDASINHDHFVYGGAKNYARSGGEWKLQPPSKE